MLFSETLELTEFQTSGWVWESEVKFSPRVVPVGKAL